MTPEQNATVLALMERNWTNFAPDPDLWEFAFRGQYIGTALEAVKALIRSSEYPPVIATYLIEYTKAERSAVGPPEIDPPQCDCDHGFVQGPDIAQDYPQGDGTMRTVTVTSSAPCGRCNPAGRERFAAVEADARRLRTRVRAEARTYEANPQAGLSLVRDALAKAKAWSPPAKPVEDEEAEE